MNTLNEHTDYDNYIKKKRVAPLTTISIHQFLDKLEGGEGIHYINCTFDFLVDLSHYVFNKKVRFHNCIFKKGVNCENTTFNQLVDFYQSTFENNQFFHLTDFLNISIFSETTFEKAVIFRHNKVSKDTYISFEKAVFKNGLDISNSNFWCTLQVFGIKIENSTPSKEILSYYLKKNLSGNDLEVERCKRTIDSLSVIPLNNFIQTNGIIKKILHQYDYKDFYEGDINIRLKNSLKITYKGLRESYRRIKQEFRKNENHIEASDFHAHEMNILKKELTISFSKENQNYSRNRRKNKLILTFNHLSNNYGKNWVSGVLFTIFTTCIFFFLVNIFLISIGDILITMSPSDLSNNINSFLKFMNPIAWNYKLYETDNPIATIITYISKIFISYGYYQTIQAFRKYGKN